MAYAAVGSLVQILKQILTSNDRFPSLHYPKPQVQSLYTKLCSLRSYLDKISLTSSALNHLESQIRDVSYKAQDTIESLISHKTNSSESDVEIPSLFLEETIANIDAITETAQNISTSIENDQLPRTTTITTTSCTDKTTRGNIVGQERQLELLTSMLLKETPNLQVIPIIGMPCIGKTTLAQSAYNDMRVQRRFPTHAWVTVSPGDPVAVILGKLLDSISIKGRDSKEQTIGSSADSLITYLHQILFNNRYLIVMDDMWHTSIWDGVRKSLPDNKNGSRIILTTTISRFAKLVSSSANNILRIPFLNEEESWKLLYRTVFTNLKETCDSQLEKIGRRIAKNCEGLPLAIIEVGKALREIKPLTVENWTEIAEYENPLIIIRRKDDDTCPISKRLSLSYKQLPQHLKACFLYMGISPKNYEIPTSKLFRLWDAEGFFEPQSGKSLEEMTGECLDELVSRSLVLVGEQTNKTCRIHFVFRNLCVDEAKHEKFFHVMRKYVDGFTQGIDSQRRLCIHNNTVLGLKEVQTSMEAVSSAGSLLCFGPKHRHPFGVYLYFKLLKVLDALTIRFYDFPQEITELVHMRYLAMTYDGEIIPGSISRLWNLQTLIVHRYHRIVPKKGVVYLPVKIWELSALRHLECIGFDLPKPKEEGPNHELENLLTLTGVSARSCAHQVLERMPNLKKLGIRIESTHIAAEDFSFFGDVTDICRRVESFKCAVMHPAPRRVGSSIGPAFPTNLRKITLSGCGFRWEDMSSAVGGLPDLQTLKLRCYAFSGPQWETEEGQFLQLEFLMLEDLDIEVWRTSDCRHFPSLRHVAIRHCYRLEEIPRELGNIATLQMMEVANCSKSAMDSAMRIQNEQLFDWGNDYLQFRLHA